MVGDPAAVRWISHYPRMVLSYRRRGEAGLEAIEAELRTAAAGRSGGKFSKRQAAYLPVVPLPPVDWRHRCGHCRFWVDHGPGEPGECMIVHGAIHEKAGCALFMPPAGERPFAWIREQLAPTGADIVRGEFHPVDDPAADARAPDASAGGPSVPAGATVGLEPFVEGLAAPVAIAFHPEADVSYVADQPGVVYVHDADGLRDQSLLDLREEIVELATQYDERGLLGLALHPTFPDDPRCFVRYSAPVRAGTPPEYDHTEILASFEVATDGRRVDRDSETTILEIPAPQFNHNGGGLAFGPEGALYVAMGDGGGEGDRGPGHVDGGNAQDVTETLLGAILRIDVDGDEPYAVPADNPMVDGTGRDELYAWGFRNPWQLSFDSEGRLLVADVGQHRFEEVNLVEKGGNYGWNIREGFHCFDPEHPTEPLGDCPDVSRRGEPLVDPILEYPHLDGDAVVGSAVIGGHVYEGAALDDLRGAYVFGDWATTQDRPSGRLFAAEAPDGDEPWAMTELDVTTTANGRPERNVLGFGRDADGELYVLANGTHVPQGETGAVLKLVPPS